MTRSRDKERSDHTIGKGHSRWADVKPEDDANWISQQAPQDSILKRVLDVAGDLGLAGNVYFFGSWASGLKTATSDCDVVFIQTEVPGKPIELPVVTLQRFATAFARHGYTNIVTVFQAVVPILKAVDPEGTDIDLTVGNLLGYHNSRLLGAYCRLDDRVCRLVQYVKQFAHHYELIHSSDGHLNSYAYSLLVVFFLMHTSPPIVPNLQALADKDPACVQDSRWGTERTWVCGYWEEVELVPRSMNTMTVEELLPSLFEFYLNFDWARHAVSIRLALKTGVDQDGRSRKLPDKFTGLQARVAREVWYVEDPFDLGHNLAAKCSPAGRQRIKDGMWRTYESIKNVGTSNVLEAFDAACPKSKGSMDDGQENSSNRKRATFYLKCRVHQKKVTPEEFAAAFAEFAVDTVYFPQGLAATATWSDDRPEAFIEFPTDYDRKEAHTINETYVSGWQLRLFTCSFHALEDAKAAGVEFDTLPGWEGSKKEADGSSEKQEGKRWRGKQKDQRNRTRGIDYLTLQRQRVQVGVEQAEGYDELNVLRQRAQGLNLKNEIKKCDDKLRLMREAREGRSENSLPGGRPRYSSGSPRLGPATNPSLSPNISPGVPNASMNSSSGVQFQ